MGRIEFPTTPIGAANTHPTIEEQNGERPFYSQPTLEWLEMLSGTEVELGNCLVTSAVTYRKRVKGNEWQCYILVSPDLLHPDQKGAYEAVASGTGADMAHSYRLRPGDRAVMKGYMQQQTVFLENGEEIMINRLAVSAIEVISRAPRKSVTVFEYKQARS
jgi:hypothetical protein